MNLFETVKYGVNCREAVERYGIEVDRYGKALCPFHDDRYPSLYVVDDHYYCFACGAHGDVIDFAANFFDLPLYEAAQRLAADFGIDTDRPPTKKILEKRRQQTEAQQLTENERLCFSVLSDYARVLREWKLRYAPQSSDETVHARFTAAPIRNGTSGKIRSTWSRQENALPILMWSCPGSMRTMLLVRSARRSIRK